MRGQPTFGNFIVYQSAQALTLQILRLVVQQCLVVASRLSIVPETVVSECEIVEAFTAALRVVTEDICSRVSMKPNSTLVYPVSDQSIV